MAVKFYIEKRKQQQGANDETPIVTSISICGSRFLTSIGYRIAPEKWDEKLQRVKKGCSNNKGIAGTNINAKIDKIKAVFAIYESECINNKKATDKAKIKAVFAANFGKEFVKTAKASDVFSVFDAFVCRESASQKWAASTTQKWSTIKKHLHDFDSKLTFESLNNEKLEQYTQYLQNDLGLRNSTMKKNISFIKWFMKWATLHGYNKNTDFETFKPKFKDTKKAVIFLDESEFKQLYNYDFSNNKCFEQVRDVFCFCCKTGLRYSDVANLKRTNVYADHIEIVTIKTHDTLKIELNNISKAILNKYKDFQFADNMALPVISNQKMNNYLKNVCLIAGIDTPITITYYKGNERIEETFPKWQLIGTHAGRRTFISYAVIERKISPQVVMKWTGHSDYKAMIPYIEISDATKENAMKIFDE